MQFTELAVRLVFAGTAGDVLDTLVHAAATLVPPRDLVSDTLRTEQKLFDMPVLFRRFGVANGPDSFTSRKARVSRRLAETAAESVLSRIWRSVRSAAPPRRRSPRWRGSARVPGDRAEAEISPPPNSLDSLAVHTDGEFEALHTAPAAIKRGELDAVEITDALLGWRQDVSASRASSLSSSQPDRCGDGCPLQSSDEAEGAPAGRTASGTEGRATPLLLVARRFRRTACRQRPFAVGWAVSRATRSVVGHRT